MYLKAWIDRETRAVPTSAWQLRQFETEMVESGAMVAEMYHSRQEYPPEAYLCELDRTPRAWAEDFRVWRSISRQPQQPDPLPENVKWWVRMLGREPREGEE